MKRKELYEYIREQIINELTPAERNAKNIKTTNATQAITDLTKKLSIKKDPKDKQEIQADLAVAKEKLAAANSMTEIELEELASYKFFRVSDRAKFDALKDIYAGTLDARVLDAVEEAGEQGITQANLASALSIASALINPILKKFGSVNAITLPVSEKPGKAAAEEPEMEEPETEEPTSTEKPGSEFFMGGDEEDEEDKAMEPIDEPVEPSAADIAAAEKELGISTADKEKVEAANKAAGIVKNLKDKIEDMSEVKNMPKNSQNEKYKKYEEQYKIFLIQNPSSKISFKTWIEDEIEKKLAALKQYIKNNRNIITKVGKISDLTNGLIS